MTVFRTTLLSLTALCASGAGAATYKVKAGDTLYSLARHANTNVQQLMRANNLSTTTLQVGQVLFLGTNNLPSAANLVATASHNSGNYNASSRALVKSNATFRTTSAKVRNAASRYLGIRYVFGGNSYRGIDCSAFTMRVFRQLGIRLPRTSREQWRRGFAVSRRNLREGDLVFFNTTGRGVSHVGIYLGRGLMANANSYRGRTVIEPVFSNPYWARRYMGARRVLQ